MNLVSELKRRNVIRTALAYAVLAWVLLQVGDILVDLLELPTAWGKGLLALLLLGFIPVLVVAWLYEITPDGIRRESELSGDPSARRFTARRLDLAVIGLVLLGLLALAADRMVPEPAAPGPTSPSAALAGEGTADVWLGPSTTDAPINPASIAVLPFADLSPEGDQEYFSDGISEEILNLLANVDGLSVASRTSSFRFKGENKSIGTIAGELRVAHVLEGSVRKAGDNIRVTAQLISADDDLHLWSNSFDRELTLEQVLEIQGDIAREIVLVLRGKLGVGLGEVSSKAIGIESLDAYELYQRAQSLPGRFDDDRFHRGIELLERATSLAPDFGKAWATLAGTYSGLPSWSTVRYPNSEWQAKAADAVDRALALDPRMPEALTSKGRIHAALGEWAEANHALEAAHDLAPEAPGVAYNLGLVLLEEGYVNRALPVLESATRVDPESGFNWMFYGMALAANGRDEEAESALSHAYTLGYRGSIEAEMSELLRKRGDAEAYRYVVATWYERSRYADLARYVIRVLLAPEAEKAEATRQFWRITEELGFDRDYLLEQTSHWEDDGIAFQHAARLGHDEVLAVPWHAATFAFVWGPGLGVGRRTPGFKEMVRIAGLDTFWREHGWPDKCRPLGNSDFECD
jgi:TolB-like protein/Tfp pilus assembly protein PilF